MTLKLGGDSYPGKSLSGTCLLYRQRPAYRWRESILGYCVELREPVVSMIREKSKGLNSKDESTDAKNRGGSVCSSEEVSVMEMERRGWVI